MDRRCGADPGQLCTQTEDRQTGRRPHFEAAGGGAISPLMDARPRAARPATVGAASAQAGADPQPGEKRTATPFSEQGHAAEAQAVEPGGTEVVARAAAKKMGGVPARGLTRTAHHVGRADRKTGCCGRGRKKMKRLIADSYDLADRGAVLYSLDYENVTDGRDICE